MDEGIKVFTLSIPEKLFRVVEKIAERNQVSVNAALDDLIAAFLCHCWAENDFTIPSDQLITKSGSVVIPPKPGQRSKWDPRRDSYEDMMKAFKKTFVKDEGPDEAAADEFWDTLQEYEEWRLHPSS